MMEVKFLDVGRINQSHQADFLNAAYKVIEQANFIRGSECSDFENEFADYCSSQHCIGVANGLDAIKLILQSLSVGKDDEVLVPAHTFIATWLAVSAVGATPVPVLTDEYFNINATDAKKKINDKTKALLVVHLYGQPANMSALTKVCQDHNLYLIEDAAQAHGATLEGKMVGSFGHAAAFSFYPSKNLGALGDGGAVVTNNSELADKVRTLANYGSEKKYIHSVLGTNSRLDELQAAFLRIKLKNLDTDNLKRQHIAERYLNEIKFPETLPKSMQGVKHVWHLFVLRVENRKSFINQLENANIQTGIHYPVIPALQRAYSDRFMTREQEIVQKMCDQLVSLPMGPHLTDEMLDYTVEHINRALSFG